MNCASRCKQAEHRSEDAGEGSTSKHIRVKTRGGLWEDEDRDKKKKRTKQGNSSLTTCTTNNKRGGLVSWEFWMKRGLGFQHACAEVCQTPN